MDLTFCQVQSLKQITILHYLFFASNIKDFIRCAIQNFSELFRFLLTVKSVYNFRSNAIKNNIEFNTIISFTLILYYGLKKLSSLTSFYFFQSLTSSYIYIIPHVFRFVKTTKTFFIRIFMVFKNPNR